jgi:Family of unknown function (DUF6589)
MTAESAPRKTRYSGRYSNSTELHQIANENCPIEINELHHENTSKVSEHLRTLDITIVDVLKHDLSNTTKGRVKKTKEWLNEEGSVELIEICGQWCDSPAFKKKICDLATRFLRIELDEFISSKMIYQPMTTITPEILTTFSSQALSETMTTHAPFLSGLFQGLLLDDRIKTPASGQRGLQKEGANEKGWLESDEEEGASSAQEPLEKKALRRQKQQTVRWVTAFSTMCYAKKSSANLYQMVLGYYLVSANTPKRVFEVLHSLGISVSYSSVIRTMKTIAEKAFQSLRNLPSEQPRFWISFDNMDFHARVRDQRLDHQGSLMHYCAGYVAINRDGDIGQMLTTKDINMSCAAKISASDIFLSTSDQKYLQNAFHFGAYTILSSYCSDSMSYMKNDKQLEPVALFPIYQIPVQKTLVSTLPVYRRNEAEMAEMSKLLREIMETLGLRNEEVEGKKIFVNGDLFTVIRARLSLH